MTVPEASPERARRDRPFRLLFVCTGNICRSPLAERLARSVLTERSVGPDRVLVLSAGVRATEGHAMHPDSAAVLVGLGGDPAGFASRQLTPSLAGDADLVLTMSRRQRADVLGADPRAMSRTFTLVEAAELVSAMSGSPASDGPGALVRGMANARSGRAGGPYDDIADPIGKPPLVHAGMGQAVQEALGPVLQRLTASLDLARLMPEPRVQGDRGRRGRAVTWEGRP